MQAQRVNATFYGIPETTVRNNGGNGFVRLTVPTDIVWYSTDVGCYDMMLKQSCSVSVGANSFTISNTVDLPAGKQFQYQLIGAFDNPISEQPSISFALTTSEGEQLASGISVIATRGGMKEFVLSSSSSVVGDSTTLQVKWRASHSIPQGGVAIMTFPVWNPNQMNPSFQKSYIQGN